MKIAMTFSWRAQPDGTVEVRGPKGELIATCPNEKAGGVILGWMRLAGYAHTLVRDNPNQLHDILVGSTKGVSSDCN